MRILLAIALVALAGCGGDDWNCVVRGETMFSMSSAGELGAANKGCTCEEITNFERRVFGSVDYEALASDHGC